MFTSKLNVPWWWYVLPTYLTIWSLVFGVWNFIDGQAMFQAFNIDFEITSAADAFIIKNSAARYLGIAAAMIVGIWLIRKPTAVITALTARLVMDVFDLIAGLQTGLLSNPLIGTLQSFFMFLAPNIITLALLFAFNRSKRI